MIDHARPSLLQRVSDSPVVPAGAVPGYGPIFNAGVMYHQDRLHLFARAIRDGYRPGPEGGPRFVDYVSDILVFESDDGERFDYAYPLSTANGDGCLEDPRVQRVHSGGREHLIITSTYLPPPAVGGPWRIGAHRIHWDGSRFRLQERSAQLLGPDGIPNKDAVIFNLADGRVALIHRIHPDIQLAIFDDLDHLWNADADYWDRHVRDIEEHVLIRPGAGALGVGAGAPPIRIDNGLLFFFHERRADGAYTMKLALLDEHTGRVRWLADEPVLVPERDWECIGDVDNVVFVQGVHRDDDHLYLTYGAADRCVGAARGSVRTLLAHLRPTAELIA